MQKEENLKWNLGQLNDLSIIGLINMFDVRNMRFCIRAIKSNNGVIQKGHSLRYTIISLLGLNKAKTKLIKFPIDVKMVIEDILRNLNDINNIGDIGLILWLCAEAAPEKLEQLMCQSNILKS